LVEGLGGIQALLLLLLIEMGEVLYFQEQVGVLELRQILQNVTEEQVEIQTLIHLAAEEQVEQLVGVTEQMGPTFRAEVEEAQETEALLLVMEETEG
jgi:hypothetical protein